MSSKTNVVIHLFKPVKLSNKTYLVIYFSNQGECPFGNKCFYRHVSADGVDVDVGPPTRRPKRQNAEGESESPRTFLLYNFLEERDGRIQVIHNFC